MNDALIIRPLQLTDEVSFRQAMAEFERETPAANFALEWARAASFAEYVSLHDRWSQGLDLPMNYVPASFFVGVVGDVIVGRVSLRHELNDFLRRVGGHIGYAVRPGYRGRGYAKAMLRQSLPIAASLGIEHALLTCDDDNIASRKVIEACGGVFESLAEHAPGEMPKRRYWIATLKTVARE